VGIVGRFHGTSRFLIITVYDINKYHWRSLRLFLRTLWGNRSSEENRPRGIQAQERFHNPWGPYSRCLRQLRSTLLQRGNTPRGSWRSHWCEAFWPFGRDSRFTSVKL